jgi:hypothetical protein
MKLHSLLSALFLLGLATTSTDVVAQGYDDLDREEETTKKKKKKKTKAERSYDFSGDEVREIVKGSYAKSNVGGAFFLGAFSKWVSPGTSLGLAYGKDFMDQETKSMAWELMFFQGIHNGQHYTVQGDAGCLASGTGPAPCVQGDLRTYTFAGTVEYSIYPTRRIGIGARVGGGVLFSPLLMDPVYYQEEIVEKEFGVEPGYHGSPHPIVMGGPTFEYYTKLSHFSVGVDVDVFYAVGFDLGASATGTMKYTF